MVAVNGMVCSCYCDPYIGTQCNPPIIYSSVQDLNSSACLQSPTYLLILHKPARPIMILIVPHTGIFRPILISNLTFTVSFHTQDWLGSINWDIHTNSQTQTYLSVILRNNILIWPRSVPLPSEWILRPRMIWSRTYMWLLTSRLVSL